MVFFLHLLAILNLHGWELALGREFSILFHFDEEQNVPTLFSVGLLALASLFCLAIGTKPVPYARSWMALFFIFAFLTLDEFAALHEYLILPSRAMAPDSSFFHFAWIIPYGLVVLLLSFLLLPWLIHLPSTIRRGLVASAVIYLFGALLMEGFSGWMVRELDPGRGAWFDAMVTVEESLEMLGLICFNYYCYRYLIDELQVQSIQLR